MIVMRCGDAGRIKQKEDHGLTFGIASGRNDIVFVTFVTLIYL
jgi:hypothetical protein